MNYNEAEHNLQQLHGAAVKGTNSIVLGQADHYIIDRVIRT